MRSAARSMPWSFLNSATIQSTIALSKLSPPRWLSPFVDFTSKTPSPSSRMDTSNVPPPRSKTRIVWSEPSLSRPYASAAAVGSLMMRTTLSPAILPASFVASRCALLKYAGTVMTASATGSPRYASASAFSFCRIIALISGGAYSLPSALTRASPFGPLTTSYGTIVISSETSSHLRPMKRLIEKIVFSGFVTCCRRAGAPTSRWPSFANATTDGVVRPPSAFGMTVGSPPSRTAMHEFVVPRSMPMVFAIERCSFPDASQMENLSQIIASYGRSADHRDERAAGNDQRGAEDETRADSFGAVQEQGREDHPEQGLRCDDRGDDRDRAPVEGLEERDVGEADERPWEQPSCNDRSRPANAVPPAGDEERRDDEA